MTGKLTLSRSLVGAACFALALVLGADSVSADHANNKWDFYRWPWGRDETRTMTQGWNGAVSHQGNLYYAIDLVLYGPSGTGIEFPVFAASDGYATCTPGDATFGNYVRIVHGSNSSLYVHLATCSGFSAQNVPQGYQIGTASNSGSTTGKHLHFQKNTSTTNFVSTAFIMNSHTNWNDGGIDCEVVPPCRVYTSDNRSAGYSHANPIVYDSVIRDKYWSAGHWDIVGSTSKITGWTPGRSSATTCGSGTQAGWYDCNFTDINGVSRAGRIQTFKGTGSGSGEHAIFKRSGASTAVFMSRGLLGPYTDIWSGSNDGTKYVGYPLGDSYSIGGTTVKMDFQNGYATYDWSNSSSRWFWWSAFLGQYVEISLADYWD
jgi:hypothetical protein